MLVRRRRLLFFMLEPPEADQGRQYIQRVVTEIRQQWQHHSPPGPVRRNGPFKTASTIDIRPKIQKPGSDVRCSCRLSFIIFQQTPQPIPTSYVVRFSKDCWSW